MVPEQKLTLISSIWFERKLMKCRQRHIYAQKAPFSSNQDIFDKHFAHSLVKFRRVFQSSPVLDDIL
jgi:hypothetical protein